LPFGIKRSISICRRGGTALGALHEVVRRLATARSDGAALGTVHRGNCCAHPGPGSVVCHTPGPLRARHSRKPGFCPIRVLYPGSVVTSHRCSPASRRDCRHAGLGAVVAGSGKALDDRVPTVFSLPPKDQALSASPHAVGADRGTPPTFGQPTAAVTTLARERSPLTPLPAAGRRAPPDGSLS